MRKLLAPSVAVIALISAASLASMSCVLDLTEDLAEPGITLRLAEHRKATISDLRYELRLSVPPDRADPVTGTMTARFDWNDPESRGLVLDFADPEGRVEVVRVGDREIRYGLAHNHIIVPARALDRGVQNEVSVDFVAGDLSLNRNDEYLYTLFVPDRAHTSIPVFDQPNLKARYEVSLDVPRDWVAVSNGLRVDGTGAPLDADAWVQPPADSEQEGSDAGVAGAEVTNAEVADRERNYYRFRETEPIPTYLLAFAAGRFEVVQATRDGRILELYHRETDSVKVARNVDDVFDLHARALAWLEDYTGIAYPFQKFAFVMIPSFQYGGMEHPGAVTYRASSLFLDESATQDQLLGRASLISHETTHMWFGDLVTMDWFDDVWMKEVFANFMAAKIVDPSFPNVDHDLRFLLAHHPAAYEVDRTEGANPIRQPLENLSDAGSLYGAIIYQKAPVVMRQLELLLGGEPFRDGLREYLTSFEYGNATWPDLIEILDRRTDEDLEAWSRIWVEEPGRPVLMANLVPYGADEVARLTLTQEDPAGEGRIWPQTLGLLLGYPGTGRQIGVRFLDAVLPLPEADGAALPSFILPDVSGAGYGRVRLDEASREYLLDHLTELDDALWRGAAWLALWDAVLEGEVEAERWADLLLRGVREERVELNVQRILGYLDTTFWTLLPATVRESRASEVEESLWRALSRTPVPTLKSAYFRAYRDAASTDDAVARLTRVWRGSESVPELRLSEDDEATLALAIAARSPEGWFEVLDEQEERIENPDRRERFNFVRPALSSEPARREEFFESLRDPANREHEPWVIEALGYLHHPLRAEHSERFILPALQLIEEIQRTGDIFFPKAWLDASLARHNTASAARIVRDFLSARPEYPPRLRGKILQSGDLLFRAADLVNGN